MTAPDRSALYAAIDRTWPAERVERRGPLTLRFTDGGGSRVRAASLDPGWTEADIAAGETAMAEAGQPILWVIRGGDEGLDAALEARGYRVKDPVTLWLAPVRDLARGPVPPVRTFEVWPPLACQREIWAEGGVGADRLRIMERAADPKITLLGRDSDTPAATVFAACDGPLAMLHALEVGARFRRRGLGADMTRAVARWAARQGASHLALLAVTANAGATALYSSLGMRPMEGYHYRIKDLP